ncbi:unnamed protein product [Symbiodinium natans]|uniref:Uncharacterized protein n=1 Tax=Symbiodinium natans TaxID=878477 RepID=A0A812QK39_9DINO|nr:unnamed protein product [Symbiodinium natans]
MLVPDAERAHSARQCEQLPYPWTSHRQGLLEGHPMPCRAPEAAWEASGNGQQGEAAAPLPSPEESSALPQPRRRSYWQPKKKPTARLLRCVKPQELQVATPRPSTSAAVERPPQGVATPPATARRPTSLGPQTPLPPRPATRAGETPMSPKPTLAAKGKQAYEEEQTSSPRCNDIQVCLDQCLVRHIRQLENRASQALNRKTEENKLTLKQKEIDERRQRVAKLRENADFLVKQMEDRQARRKQDAAERAESFTTTSTKSTPRKAGVSEHRRDLLTSNLKEECASQISDDLLQDKLLAGRPRPATVLGTHEARSELHSCLTSQIEAKRLKREANRKQQLEEEVSMLKLEAQDIVRQSQLEQAPDSSNGHGGIMKREIALLLTWLVPSLATSCPAIAYHAGEKTCDSSKWVCRIMCSQDMLPNAKSANWCLAKHCASTSKRHKHIVEGMMAAGQDFCSRDLCFIQESEATGLLQKPSREGTLSAAQVNATKRGGCLTEGDVCSGFCEALGAAGDSHCLSKCTDCVDVIVDALGEYCDSCAGGDYKTTEKPTTTEEETTTEEPTTTEEETTTEEPTTTAKQYKTTTTEEPTTTTVKQYKTTTTEEPTTTTVKQYKTTTTEESTTTEDDDGDGGRRRRKDDDGGKDDDGDGGRRRRKYDDDGKDGGRRRKYDDDGTDGGRRRKSDDDGKDGGRRRKYDDDGTDGGRRRKYDDDGTDGGRRRKSDDDGKDGGRRRKYDDDGTDGGRRRKYDDDGTDGGRRRKYDDDGTDGGRRRKSDDDGADGGRRRKYDDDGKDGGRRRRKSDDDGSKPVYFSS